MSVLTCPVCQGSMKEISKNGVLIDSCTQCRGVWLDRGELEKLAAVVGGSDQRSFLGGATAARSSDRRYDHDDDDDDDRRHRHDQSRPKRRSFLDFFD